jgi:uncharacterized protein (TIGR02270 family)
MDELVIPDFLHKPPVYRDIFEQYATDASFLWLLRSIAVEQPHYDKKDLLSLENRIDAQLDGLMTAIDVSWPICAEALSINEPGEVFTAMIIAMRSREPSRIKQAVNVGLADPLCFKALVSAMGWLPTNLVSPWISRFLSGKEMVHKLLGIASCSVKRQDPGAALNHIINREECIAHEALYARSLRLIGELRRQDCMPALVKATEDSRDSIRFWSLWSAILLGQKSYVELLKPFILDSESPFQNNAMEIVFRVLTIERARAFISEIAQNQENIRIVIKATGILGDPHAVNWLITQMQDDTLAKLAGEAFVLITGAELSAHKLIADQDENAVNLIKESEGNVELDEDEHLLIPDYHRVTKLWRSYGQKFIVGRRYFLGKNIEETWLNKVLSMGNQRQRHAAALELALGGFNISLINTRAKVEYS